MVDPSEHPWHSRKSARPDETPPQTEPETAATTVETPLPTQAAAATPWSMKKTIAAVAVAGTIAVAGGVAIYTATDHHSTQDAGAMGPGAGPFMQDGPGNGPGAPMPLHGEFVVADPKGGYRTELTQTGVVTDMSSTSITAKSTDNYIQTYTLTGTTAPSSIKAGDTVIIRGTRSGTTVSATEIHSGNETGTDNIPPAVRHTNSSAPDDDNGPPIGGPDGMPPMGPPPGGMPPMGGPGGMPPGGEPGPR